MTRGLVFDDGTAVAQKQKADAEIDSIRKKESRERTRIEREPAENSR